MLKRLINRIRCREVVYGGNFFKKQWFIEWSELKIILAKLIMSDPNWISVLDFGCGPGVMIDYMVSMGIDYIGCDYSSDAKGLYLENFGQNPDRYVSGLDILKGKRFDLLLAFDVLEHMKDEEVSRLIRTVSPIPYLFFNISRERRIEGHINIKPDNAWITCIDRLGYSFDRENTNRLRRLYKELRPNGQEKWNSNIFLFKYRSKEEQ